MIQVLCASLGDRSPKGLEYIPGDYEITFCKDKPWAKAANRLLDHAAECGDWALFLDDDIELTPHTFRQVQNPERLYRLGKGADCIGFTLLGRDGAIQSAGHQFVPVGDSVQMQPLQSAYDLFTPRYVAHVTASCFLLSPRFLASPVRFPEWEGQHHEDVAYTIEAWRQGFKVAYVPGAVWHDFNTQAGAGATKATMETFQSERATNWIRLQEWYREIDLRQLCIDGVVPVGSQEIA
jgi:hypothetical protein